MEVGEDFIDDFDGKGSDGGSSSGRSEDEGGKSSSKVEEGEEASSWFAGFVGAEGCEKKGSFASGVMIKIQRVYLRGEDSRKLTEKERDRLD